MKKFLLSYIPESLISKERRNTCLTFTFIALIMLVLEYYGWQGPFINHISKQFGFFTPAKNELFLKAQIYTSCSFFSLLFILPLIFNYLFPIHHPTLKNIGLDGTDWKQAFLIYIPLVVLMMPILWIICKQPSFYQFYPLYKPNSLKMFFIYELIYLTQFVSIEFFFRGFGLFRAEKIMPGYGIFIMIIPYSLVHIHKPFEEAIGSIFAGLVLGHLALKSKSIWPGVLVHACIAFSADLFAMIHSGRFQAF
ncbi:MAG: CPBP family intramembrane metalloprotease [Bacteriovoracaceae bacterium]|nr:CPBP family intramembrane metalloprotease [Bacteriovoracaceae bacterium]